MTASTADLAVGTHRAVVVLSTTAGNSPMAIPVTLVFSEQQPVIAVAPSTIALEGTAGRAGPAPVTVAVTTCVPALRLDRVKAAPVPMAPSRSELQRREAPRSPSNESLALPAKGTAPPKANVAPFTGDVMPATGGAIC